MRRLRARWSWQLSGDDNDDHEDDCSDDDDDDELVVVVMVMMMLVSVHKWGNHSSGVRIRWTFNSDGDVEFHENDETANKWMNP